MKLLDLFSGAGGAAVGYHRAGFDTIFGVDHAWQDNYPFDFLQADALETLKMLIESGNIERFDLVHASPPCQAYSATSPMSNGNHPRLVSPVRELLKESGVPYVIENVPGAPLENPLMLCGTMFPELRVIRHRLFECSPVVWFPPSPCNHWGKATGANSKRRKNGGTISLEDGYDFVTVCGNDYLADEGRMAMQIDWTTKAELSQAIPPPYTEWLGTQLLEQLTGETEHGTARADLAAFAALLLSAALVWAGLWLLAGW